MNTDAGKPANMASVDKPLWRRILGWPSTRLGWWAVGLMAAFVVLILINNAVFMQLPEVTTWRVFFLPLYAIVMLLCGLAAGVAALVAIILKRERSVLAWLPVLTGLFVVVFLLGEFLVPH